MGKAWAAVIGILDAFPFALGLRLLLMEFGHVFPPGQRLAISAFLGLGFWALLATISAYRYATDGSRFWLVWSFVDLLIWWI